MLGHGLDVLRSVVLVFQIPASLLVQNLRYIKRTSRSNRSRHRGPRSISFIAHTMGELDCRYLFSHTRPNETPSRLRPYLFHIKEAVFVDWWTANTSELANLAFGKTMSFSRIRSKGLYFLEPRRRNHTIDLASTSLPQSSINSALGAYQFPGAHKLNRPLSFEHLHSSTPGLGSSA